MIDQIIRGGNSLVNLFLQNEEESVLIGRIIAPDRARNNSEEGDAINVMRLKYIPSDDSADIDECVSITNKQAKTLRKSRYMMRLFCEVDIFINKFVCCKI